MEIINDDSVLKYNDEVMDFINQILPDTEIREFFMMQLSLLMVNSKQEYCIAYILLGSSKGIEQLYDLLNHSFDNLMVHIDSTIHNENENIVNHKKICVVKLSKNNLKLTYELILDKCDDLLFLVAPISIHFDTYNNDGLWRRLKVLKIFEYNKKIINIIKWGKAFSNILLEYHKKYYKSNLKIPSLLMKHTKDYYNFASITT